MILGLITTFGHGDNLVTKVSSTLIIKEGLIVFAFTPMLLENWIGLERIG